MHNINLSVIEFYCIYIQKILFRPLGLNDGQFSFRYSLARFALNLQLTTKHSFTGIPL